MLASLDLHDVLVLIDGRPELADETAQEPQAIRNYIAAELAAVVKGRNFRYLAESAMHPYGELRPDRANRLIEQTTRLIKTISR